MRRIKKKGFTLMELIIVIAIIGILASIIYPGFLAYTEKAKLTRAIQDAKTLVAAVDTYNSEQEADAITEETNLSDEDLNSAIVGKEKPIKKLPTEFSSELKMSHIRDIAESKINDLKYDKTTGKVSLKSSES